MLHSSSGAEVHLVGVSHVSAFSGHLAYRTIKHVQPDCVVLEVDERYVELCTWLGALSNSANASPTLHMQWWKCKVITNVELLDPSAGNSRACSPGRMALLRSARVVERKGACAHVNIP